MRIITYQHKKVVDYLKKHGEYKVTNKSQMKTLLRLTRPYSGEMFTEAYDYMFNRMNKKIKNQRNVLIKANKTITINVYIALL